MDKSSLRALAIISQLGLSIAIPLGLGIVLGIWLDNNFGTSPWFTLAGIAVGLIVAVLVMARLVMFQRDPEDVARDRANFAAKAKAREEAAQSQAEADQQLLNLFGNEDDEAQGKQDK